MKTPHTHLFFCIVYLLFHCNCGISATYTANGSGAWESSSTWSSAPDASTLSGNISSGSVLVSGTVVRNGALSVSNSLTVSGVLNVIGNMSGSNPLIVPSGGVLYISGNLVSTGLSITVESGGTLVVGGSTTLSGGSMTINGNFVALGDFTMNSISATLSGSGNIVVGGNFNFSNGSFSVATPVNSMFYLIGSNPTVSFPSYYTSICTTSGQSCTYGNASDLISNDPTLANYVSTIKGCILTEPSTSCIGCVGSSVTINLITYGAGVNYQWQYSSDDGTTWSNIPSSSSIYSGSTTNALSIVSSVALSGYKYRCAVSGSCAATSTVSKLTVYNSPTITSQPVSVCSYSSATAFTVVASGSGLTYQWQKSTDGINFTNITADWGYTNVNTSTLNVSAWRESSTTYYRCMVSSNGCFVYSNVAVLTTAKPLAAGTIIGTATVCANSNNIAYNIAQITGAAMYVWTYSGTGVTISGNSQNITLTFSSSATSGNLTVYGQNACGNGTVSSAYAISLGNAATLSSTLTPAAICSNTVFTYTPTSLASGATYSWSRASVAGISNSATLGSGSINETLINTTSSPITVTYIYTIYGTTCSSTASVNVIVNPVPTTTYMFHKPNA